MATRMLIDARHPEETRVAVIKGNRIEEFDFESAEHKQIKGNIYLAKVTRVEPSLQAAFVDFGGNRHGFLAFSEIHPDYYQIPKADRDALIQAEAEAAEEEARLRAEEEDRGEMPGDEYDAENPESAEALVEEIAEDGVQEVDTSEQGDVATIEDGRVEDDGDHAAFEDHPHEGDGNDAGEQDGDNGRQRRGRRRQGRGQRERTKEVDDARARRQELRRRYKIQDVIQRRQVLLVQVVKEERGNKGAALTTYLSLAGRYCVLMPNSTSGGGISRKISSAGDRKRLKQIVSDLSLPRTMGLIVRTAGLERTRTEIKRDFDYLARVWDEIRERTLASAAPALIHSDSDLIKRAIRDIYNREIEEVVVEGEEGYKSAKQFMKLLMPSHARRVKAYSDPVPLFQRYGAEDQLRAMYDPVVQLKSGGYLVINPTEALVSIDINSGRSTKEHGIEATACNTNLEAAKEIARQLRLRDMAGLVVIDFIDMEYSSNIRKVEKCMKDALKNDRARIQIGRISSFGLMEMSRQRLRTGVLEATTRDCPHCDGTGLVRTASSAGLSALRLIEDEAARGKGSVITLSASTEAAIYLLNEKRADLQEIEHRYNVKVEVLPEGEDEGAKMRIASSGPPPAEAPRFDPIVDDDDDDYVEEDSDDREEDDGERGDGDASRKRRRSRGGRNRNRRREELDESTGEERSLDEADEDETAEPHAADGDGEERPKKRRRRGGRRRRGRGNGENGENGGYEGGDNGTLEGPENDAELTPTVAEANALQEIGAQVDADMPVAPPPPGEDEADVAPATEDKPKRRSRARKAQPAADMAEDGQVAETADKPKRAPRARKKADVPAEATAEPAEAEVAAEPKQRRAPRRKAPAKAEPAELIATETVEIDVTESSPAMLADQEAPVPASAEDDTPRPAKRGWWQRTFGD
ncbi:Rne/Rng family ribonuclease [Qipengyuania sp. YIM B01966]|uniref:Rne/Rng family ribonuclease n=1 Tax=Qipengyuania sp. YIM B01966 TaxID=2778646 RepID=UPI0018F771D4|nr:ribonuclease E/G [Qipengyuania sp. YIM B01966]